MSYLETFFLSFLGGPITLEKQLLASGVTPKHFTLWSLKFMREKLKCVCTVPNDKFNSFVHCFFVNKIGRSKLRSRKKSSNTVVIRYVTKKEHKIWRSFVKIWLAWLIFKFFDHNASWWSKSILKTNKTSFASNSLVQKSWSNFNLRSPDAYFFNFQKNTRFLSAISQERF